MRAICASAEAVCCDSTELGGIATLSFISVMVLRWSSSKISARPIQEYTPDRNAAEVCTAREIALNLRNIRWLPMAKWPRSAGSSRYRSEIERQQGPPLSGPWTMHSKWRGPTAQCRLCFSELATWFIGQLQKSDRIEGGLGIVLNLRTFTESSRMRCEKLMTPKIQNETKFSG